MGIEVAKILFFKLRCLTFKMFQIYYENIFGRNRKTFFDFLHIVYLLMNELKQSFRAFFSDSSFNFGFDDLAHNVLIHRTDGLKQPEKGTPGRPLTHTSCPFCAMNVRIPVPTQAEGQGP